MSDFFELTLEPLEGESYAFCHDCDWEGETRGEALAHGRLNSHLVTLVESVETVFDFEKKGPPPTEG